MEKFKELGLSKESLDVLKNKGFEVPTPIQEQVIPVALTTNKDIVGQAQTGTGKTAAFGLPIIELLEEKSHTVKALVLTPTRELAIQVSEEINSLKGSKRLSVIPVYGGQSIELQLRALRKGVDIVVGTPGRILDHIRRNTLKLDDISFLVLDEADEMLNMGFIEDVTEIMKVTSSDKRTMLFSATMPAAIMDIAKKYMKDHEVFRVAKAQLTVSATDQIYFEVRESDKFEALCRIIDIEEEFYGLVFCRTKKDADKIAHHMIERGYDADALHGDMSQAMREKILNKFKKGIINILVATDVAARGIDVQNLTHVINYALPRDPESYVHRIGRTGRAGKEGNAVTFITPREYSQFKRIRDRAKTNIRREKVPGIKDIITSKKKRIKTSLADIVDSGLKDEYLKLSGELLETNDPQDILAAMLQHSFGSELETKSYSDIRDTGGVDTRGKTRLFVQQGKVNGLTAKKLAQLIQDKCKVKNHDIRDIQIFDRFSFVSMPFNEAEKVLTYFKKNKGGKGLSIQKAKKDRGRG